MRMISKLLAATALAAAIAMPAAAKDLQKIGISVGLLGNPFFVATIKGIEDRAKEINPNVQVTSVSADYDLNKQVSQIDSFIAAGVDIIMLNAVDAKAIAPAVKKVTYKIDLKRVINRRLILGVGDGILEADGKPIYEAIDLKVGLNDPKDLV